ncbi:TIGR02444 family protein [Phenylobacterium sp.]|uniref:TIGR02444 family protein n=1 Tax=Phenylobacterium sp. TaxID=1871053 RepID=UPI00286D223D|nr:TIGR02444 family protein [Phenylobacterium sp.]
MTLWNWTLSAYARDGAPQACLTLQDVHGQNTSLLLWAVWAETDDARLLDRAADVARRWEALALGPLRDIRRALKPAFTGVEDDARQGLREDVKAAELRAERVLLETLETLSKGRGGAHALTALEAASRAWGRPAPPDALAALAAALG